MRWNNKTPDVGDTRKNSGFLLLPKTIDGETRWLEFATWTEEYIQIEMDGECDYFWNPAYWGDTRCPHGYEDWDNCPDCRH